jgi:hypothetical protein
MSRYAAALASSNKEESSYFSNRQVNASINARLTIPRPMNNFQKNIKIKEDERE